MNDKRGSVQAAIGLGLVLGLSVIILVHTPGVRAKSPALPGGFVAFVGNENVDLMWDPVACDSYKILRDGTEIFGEIKQIEGKQFFRDGFVQDGENRTYQVCALTGDEEDCTPVESVAVGDVHGHLFQDLEWKSGAYALTGDVTLENLAVLTIKGNASVMGSSVAHYAITDDNGILKVVGTAAKKVPIEQVDLFLLSGTSVIEHAALGTDWQGEGYFILLQGSNPLRYSTIKKYDVRADNGTPVFEEDNIFLGRILLGGTANATINKSTFYGPKALRLRDSARATLTNSTTTGCPAEPGNLEVIDMGGASLTVEGSNLSGFLCSVIFTWANRGGVVTVRDSQLNFGHGGIWASLRPAEPEAPPANGGTPQITAENNVFRGNGYGIMLSAGASAVISHNTFLLNGDAISGGAATGTIANNCIAQNSIGLLWTAGNIQATQNWWGSKKGPKVGVLDTPGDPIVMDGEATVYYNPFLETENCASEARNLGISYVTVTQSVQDLANGKNLTAGKPTIVRAFVASIPGEIGGVTGRLTGMRGGISLGEVEPAVDNTPQMRINSAGLIDWVFEIQATKNASLNFRLPDDWLHGTVNLIVEINPDRTIAENNYGDNTFTQELTFRPPAPVKVGVVPVNYTGGGSLQAASAGSLLDLYAFMEKVYPTDQIEPILQPAVDWPYRMKIPNSYNPQENRLGKTLMNVLRLKSILGQAGGSQDGGQLFGVFAGDATSFSMLEPPAQSGMGITGYFDTHPLGLAQMAAYNRDVTGYGIPISYWYGFDVLGDRVMDRMAPEFILATQPYDIDQMWTHAEVQDALWEAFTSQQKPAETESALTYLIAQGIVYKQSQAVVKVDFAPTWQVITTNPPPLPPVGTGYCLELQGAGGTVLASHCFNLPAVENAWVDSFTVALPLSGIPERLVLKTGGAGEAVAAEIGALEVSAHAPTVHLVSPNGGETIGASLNASWTAADADGDVLAYNLLFSDDNGATWLPVRTGITETQATLDLSLVPGSASSKLRVEVSDGFHTAQDDSDGTFNALDKPPLVEILSPASGFVTDGEVIDVLGAVYDAEDGALDGAALQWASSIDGALGSGRRLLGVRLSPGVHTITLAAADSGGNAAAQSVTVIVGAADEGQRVYLPVMVR